MGVDIERKQNGKKRKVTISFDQMPQHVEEADTYELRVIAHEMFAGGYSMSQIQRALGIKSHSTIRKWIHALDQESDISEEQGLNQLSEKVQNRLVTKNFSLANRILSMVTDQDIRKASLQQKTISSSVLIDKARLLNDQSTANILGYQKKNILIKTEKETVDEGIQALEAKIALLEEEIMGG